MTSILFTIVDSTWRLGAEMAPYLFLGFAVAGFLHVFWPIDSIKRHLGGNSALAVFKASVVGIPLPLCSCGVLPVATALRKSGAGAAPTLSFLITTPVTGVDSLLATWAFLGWFFTLMRLFVSLLVGLVTGLLAALFLPEPAEPSVEPSSPAESCCTTDGGSCESPGASEKFSDRIFRMLRYGLWELPGSIADSVFLGLLVGGVITALVPAELVADTVGTGFLGVVVAVLVAIPLYVCANGSIPIAAVLMLKGFSPGAALAFLIAGPATNAVGITTIRKLLGWRHLAVYLAVIFLGSLGAGWILDRLLAVSGTSLAFVVPGGHAGHSLNWIKILSGVLLFGIFFFAGAWPWVMHKFRGKTGHKKEESMSSDQTRLNVPDMTCNHCKSAVTRIVSGFEGVNAVEVDLGDKTVTIRHEIPIALPEITAALDKAGYPVKP